MIVCSRSFLEVVIMMISRAIIISLIEVPATVKVVSVTAVVESSAMSTAIIVVMKCVEWEDDRWRLWLLLTEIAKFLIIVREACLEFFFELFYQGDFQRIQFRLIAIVLIVIAR